MFINFLTLLDLRNPVLDCLTFLTSQALLSYKAIFHENIPFVEVQQFACRVVLFLLLLFRTELIHLKLQHLLQATS